MEINTRISQNHKELLDKLIACMKKLSEGKLTLDYEKDLTNINAQILRYNKASKSFVRIDLSHETGRVINYKNRLFYISIRDKSPRRTYINVFALGHKGDKFIFIKIQTFSSVMKNLRIDLIAGKILNVLDHYKSDWDEIEQKLELRDIRNKQKKYRKNILTLAKRKIAFNKPILGAILEDSCMEASCCMSEEMKLMPDNQNYDKGKEYISYPILYGTNRKEITSHNKRNLFGKVIDTKLNLGICNVSIPESHVLCEIERPNWLQNMIFGESPRKHFTILDNKIINESLFIDKLKERFAESAENDVLLFIHGYNVKFNDAIYRTAQLGYDLSFRGVTTAFSWASCGTVREYMTDVENARCSAKYLCDYIKLILSSSDINKLHIVAHSMGNVVLCEALMMLKEQGCYPGDKINQIILAAPDIDKRIFVDIIWPKIKKEPNITLYASDKDRALLVSRTLRSGYERVGEIGNGIMVADGLDSVDASEVDTDIFGHSYCFATQSLLSDIHEILKNQKPGARMLDMSYDKRYWILKRTKN